jgi:hypothetical protein
VVYSVDRFRLAGRLDVLRTVASLLPESWSLNARKNPLFSSGGAAFCFLFAAANESVGDTVSIGAETSSAAAINSASFRI